MIRLDDVGFGYGAGERSKDDGGREILCGVSAAINPGELVCIVGANGAGKTTLLKLIGGLLAPTGGFVRCADMDPFATHRRKVARVMSYLPQHYELAFPYTASEVVLMGRYAHGGGGLGLENSTDLTVADAAMEHCDVRELADRRFDQLSGGEQRRVLLAQAFCQHAPIILLDEPTASLDPAHAISMFEALRADTRQRDSLVLLVTHDLNLAARFADRVLLLDSGALTADGDAADVLASEATARAFKLPFYVGALPDKDATFVVPA